MDDMLFNNMEILKAKFNISYKEAKEVLESNNNDLIESLIFLEGIYGYRNSCSLKSYIDDVKSKIISLYKEGSNQRIIISRKGEFIADIPLTAVVISSFAFVLYPILLPIKIGGVLLFDIDFKIVDKSGKVYHVNSDIKDKVNHAFSTSKEKISDMISGTDIKSTADGIKTKAVEFSKKAINNFNGIIENKISKGIKEKASSYAKFVYDSESDSIEEKFVSDLEFEEDKDLSNDYLNEFVKSAENQNK